MNAKPNLRVGLGFDFHPFKAGRRLFLGGVTIPHTRGLDGHSDADVLLHAVCDALLGAAGLGDIGTHFPETDPKYRDISSLVLLRSVVEMVCQSGYAVANVDVVILAEEPRIQPHVAQIRANMAPLLRLEPSEIGVKATTMEGRGPIGRREGLAAKAVVLLYRV